MRRGTWRTWIVGACAVGSYAAGVLRVHRAGGRWPVTRALAWLAGWALTLFLMRSIRA